jgi:hypothetical protein
MTGSKTIECISAQALGRVTGAAGALVQRPMTFDQYTLYAASLGIVPSQSQYQRLIGRK